jgi:hypothetical protein
LEATLRLENELKQSSRRDTVSGHYRSPDLSPSLIQPVTGGVSLRKIAKDCGLVEIVPFAAMGPAYNLHLRGFRANCPSVLAPLVPQPR